MAGGVLTTVGFVGWKNKRDGVGGTGRVSVARALQIDRC